MSKRTRVSVVWLGLAVAFVAMTGAIHQRTWMEEVGEALTTYRASVSCVAECTHQLCQLTSQHRLNEDGGSDQGVAHNCIETDAGCDYHACGGGGGELDGLADLLMSADAEDLRALEALELGVSVNLDRDAVQVVGCGNEIALSVPLSDGQLAGLMLQGA